MACCQDLCHNSGNPAESYPETLAPHCQLALIHPIPVLIVGLLLFDRPLVLGVRRGASGGEEWCVASEDCAFGPIGFKRVRDVRPGEMIVVDPSGQLHSRQCVPGQVRLFNWGHGKGQCKALT